MKNSKLIIIVVFIIIGFIYGLVSAFRNQNPHYPAVGSQVANEEQMLNAWRWEPSPIWFTSYALCKVPRNGFGICHTRSGYLFRSKGGRILYFTGSTVLEIAFCAVLGGGIIKLQALFFKKLDSDSNGFYHPPFTLLLLHRDISVSCDFRCQEPRNSPHF
jgi:hypothetical protein